MNDQAELSEVKPHPVAGQHGAGDHLTAGEVRWEGGLANGKQRVTYRRADGVRMPDLTATPAECEAYFLRCCKELQATGA